MTWRLPARLLALAGAAVGCVAGPAAPAGSEPAARDPIVGGALERGFPLVGALAVDDMGWEPIAFCTATAVTPTVLLTAAHCLDAFDDLEGLPVVFVQTDEAGSRLTDVDPWSRVTHPRWGWDMPGYLFDIGVVQLVRPLDARVYPQVLREPITYRHVGAELLAVGYGVTEPWGEDAGVKRSIAMSLTAAYDEYFEIHYSPSEDWRGVCYGDSGGPSFLLGERREVQYGVHARTMVEECGPGEDTSVGFFYASFVRDAVLRADPAAADCGDRTCTGLEIEEDCPLDCGPAVCGNGALEAGEVCDDGNVRDADGCSSTCLSDESCGNGILDVAAGEVCEDGNRTGGDGCSADCRSDERCGNGLLDAAAGEACDDGNHAPGDGCSADCRSDERCGNGVLDPIAGEVCDDGNVASGDGCSSTCLSDESCGNGVLDVGAGEACDDGNRVGGDGCPADCRSDLRCGNGIVDEAMGEACDDGNRVDGDGCPATCGVPPLGRRRGGCACGAPGVARVGAPPALPGLLGPRWRG